MTASRCLLDQTNTVDTMNGYRSSLSQQQRPLRYPPSPRRSGPRASDEPSWRDSDRHRSREQQRPADRSDSRSRQRDHRDTKDSRHESHNSRRSDDSSRDKRAGGRSPSRDHPQRPRSSSQRRSPPRAATASRDKRDSNSRTGPAAAVPKQPPAQNSNAFELLEKFLGKQAALQVCVQFLCHCSSVVHLVISRTSVTLPAVAWHPCQLSCISTRLCTASIPSTSPVYPCFKLE